MQPNVLLVVLDTVRARNLSAYGYHRETTPFLERFAAESATLYEQARAPAARSLDSHVSIFTGLAVEEHGVTTTGDKLAPEHSVFDQLRADSYATGVFTENSWLTDVDAGLKDGFDTVEGPRNVPFPDALDPTAFVVEHGQGAYRAFLSAALKSDAPGKTLLNGLAVKLGSDYPGFLPADRVSSPAEQYVDLFLDWERDQDGPWAACVNLMDAHHPYEPDAEYDRWGDDRLRALQDDIEDVKWEFNGGQRQWWQRQALEALYDGAIRQLDAQVQRLVETLEARDTLDDTLVVLSDHGEGFGEPSHVRPDTNVASHSVGIHEVLMHVPLVVKAPGQDEGRRIPEVCSITGFPKAIRAAREGEQPDTAFRTDEPVIATAHGLDDPVQERACQYCDELSPFTATARAVWEGSGIGVTKSTTWRDRVDRRICRDAATTYAVDAKGGEGAVETAFADLTQQDVKVEGSGLESLAADAYENLEDLGYV
ncbi:sulfatase [Halobacteriales archaeon Cl-PHB]